MAIVSATIRIKDIAHFWFRRKYFFVSLLESDPRKWNPALSNEIGRLSQGIRNIKGNDAVEFIPISEVPSNKKAT